MKLVRVVHTNARPIFGPLSKIAPDLTTVGGDLGKPETAFALGFLDDDKSEGHIYVLSEEQKTRLVELLTGVAVPRVLRPT